MSCSCRRGNVFAPTELHRSCNSPPCSGLRRSRSTLFFIHLFRQPSLQSWLGSCTSLVCFYSNRPSTYCTLSRTQLPRRSATASSLCQTLFHFGLDRCMAVHGFLSHAPLLTSSRRRLARCNLTQLPPARRPYLCSLARSSRALCQLTLVPSRNSPAP